jgi:Flp pilus assembly pilin Flp
MGFDAHPQAEGPGPAQYALILALMAIAAVLALVFLSGTINTILRAVAHSTPGDGRLRLDQVGMQGFEAVRRLTQGSTDSIHLLLTVAHWYSRQ